MALEKHPHRSFEVQTPKEVIELIVFRMSEQEYGIPIGSVQEIIMGQRATRIPNAPPFMEGVINLRGKIIPIVDARKRLGLEEDADDSPASSPPASEERVIILQIDDETIGLVVEAVSEVLKLPRSSMEQPPQDITVNARFVTSIGKHQGRLLILLDPSKLLASPEAGMMLEP